MVLFRDSLCLFAGGRVRHRRAAGNHVQRVAEDVAQHDAENLRRSAGLCKSAALDARKPLANGIHLHDVGTAGEKLAGDVLQFFTRNQRFLE